VQCSSKFTDALERDAVPKAMIAQLQGQNQQLQQQLQAAALDHKYRLSVEQMRQQGESERASMQDETKRHDVASRDTTARDIEEIKGHIALLLAHVDERKEARALESAAKNDATH